MLAAAWKIGQWKIEAVQVIPQIHGGLKLGLFMTAPLSSQLFIIYMRFTAACRKKYRNKYDRQYIGSADMPEVANHFQIACQYFKFEKQKHSRVPCTFFLLHSLLFYYKNIFNVFCWLSKINVTSAVVGYGSSWRIVKVLYLENIL